MTTEARRVLVVAGLGKGTGTGAAVARLFSKAGYSVALIARDADSIEVLAKELRAAGRDVTPFHVTSYDPQEISSAWNSIRTEYPSPSFTISAAIFNVGRKILKGFLDLTPAEVRDSFAVNVEGAFAFSREAILTFKENGIDQTSGKRGTLIFTGATASFRGDTITSAFAAGKFGVRALSQSLSKEFGKDNIHVAHAIIDGNIATERLEAMPHLKDKPDLTLSPDSIANMLVLVPGQPRQICVDMGN